MSLQALIQVLSCLWCWLQYALGDVVVFQTEGRTWSRPQMPAHGPHSRAFHCAAAVSTKVFLFGGHVWVKEKKGLQKFNDLWCLNTVGACHIAMCVIVCNISPPV